MCSGSIRHFPAGANGDTPDCTPSCHHKLQVVNPEVQQTMEAAGPSKCAQGVEDGWRGWNEVGRMGWLQNGEEGGLGPGMGQIQCQRFSLNPFLASPPMLQST